MIFIFLLLGHVSWVHDDMQPCTVLLVLRDFGKVQRPQLWEHADDGGSVVRDVFKGVAVEREAVHVRELLQNVEVGELSDFVPVQVDHFKCGEFEDVLGDGGDVIEAEVQPGDVFGILHHVQGHLVEAFCVHQVVVGQTDHVGVVAT